MSTKDRKQIILDTAFELFIEHGIHQTSVQMILDASQVAKGTFYKYFNSKIDIVHSLIEQQQQEIQVIRMDLAKGRDASSLELLIDQLAKPMKSPEKRHILELFQFAADSEDFDLASFISIEIRWLADRLVEVYGDDIEPYAIEGAMLFFGMLTQTILTWKSLYHTEPEFQEVFPKILRNIEAILHSMKNAGDTIFDRQTLAYLSTGAKCAQVEKCEIMEQLATLMENTKHTKLPKAADELTRGLHSLMQEEPLNHTLVNVTLRAFIEEYAHTEWSSEARRIYNGCRLYLEAVRS